MGVFGRTGERGKLSQSMLVFGGRTKQLQVRWLLILGNRQPKLGSTAFTLFV